MVQKCLLLRNSWNHLLIWDIYLWIKLRVFEKDYWRRTNLKIRPCEKSSSSTHYGSQRLYHKRSKYKRLRRYGHLKRKEDLAMDSARKKKNVANHHRLVKGLNKIEAIENHDPNWFETFDFVLELLGSPI